MDITQCYNSDTTQLTLPYYFNESLNNIIFQESLESIIFGHYFNQPLDNIKFPPLLKSFTFGYFFNQPINNIKFPPVLKSITFGYSFNQTLDNLPNTIKYIVFEILNRNITNLPISVERIVIINKSSYNKYELKVPFGCSIVDRYGKKLN